MGVQLDSNVSYAIQLLTEQLIFIKRLEFHEKAGWWFGGIETLKKLDLRVPFHEALHAIESAAKGEIGADFRFHSSNESYIEALPRAVWAVLDEALFRPEAFPLDEALDAIAVYLTRELEILELTQGSRLYLKLFNGLALLTPRSYPVKETLEILSAQIPEIRIPLNGPLKKIAKSEPWFEVFSSLEQSIGLPPFVCESFAVQSGVSFNWMYANMIDQLIFETHLMGADYRH